MRLFVLTPLYYMTRQVREIEYKENVATHIKMKNTHYTFVYEKQLDKILVYTKFIKDTYIHTLRVKR